MADFTSEFWNIYIIVLTLLGIGGCALLLWSQSKVKIEIKPGDKAGTTGHDWDGVTELNNPMPRWWMWLFYITIVFALVYLVLYPGLGNYAGKLGWKSSGEYQEELQKADAQYKPLFDKYLQQDIKAVAADPQARAIGERLFLTYCAQCHGSDAGGAKGYPNLTDRDWLYGGSPETIKTTIMLGRNGHMPPMGEAVGSEKDIENVANYVLSLSGSTHDPIKAALGKEKFGACAACHGAGGVGNQALGAPNLSDKIWLHGGSKDAIMETIRKGRTSTMPPFGEFLGEAKVQVLAAYVWSRSNSTESAQEPAQKK
ncbi:MAG: cytochrome-c oxidase, cbb3-type subunit III [Proteobacteria bacterium]|nr:cytochrome-c oxidase, cbb3-type subunit III [Pseudomonadota bacterium]